jgi:ferrous iron transport protein B
MAAIAHGEHARASTRGGSCHGGAPEADGRPTIALVGHPNVGKSLLFRRLTGRYVNVSNYPGTTVEIERGTARFAPDTAVVDTPGIVAFPARTEDERIVSRILVREPVASVVQVGDAKSLVRTMLLFAQLAELRVPMVLALNMADEAAARGVGVDRAALAVRLGVPVALTVATSGAGVDELVDAIDEPAEPAVRLAYPQPIEAALDELEMLLPPSPVAARGLALLWLSGDEEAEAWVGERVGDDVARRLVAIRASIGEVLGQRASSAIQGVWLAFADEVAAAVTSASELRNRGVLDRIARLTTHRIWGWPILAAVLYAVYLLVGVLGAGNLVGLIEERLFGAGINPRVTDAVRWLIPARFFQDLFVGEYGLWTMGMTYALALILPIVTTFLLAFSVLEDSGYLPRLAVVSNRIFARLGLNGKAALPMVLGLGCVTMATLTTRILESRRERLLATLLLALGIPCSAQLGVVLGMLGSISFVATLIWSAVVLAIVLTVGALAAKLVPGERSTLLLELPPLRVPRVSNVLLKTAVRVEWYLKEVVPLFLIGTAALFVLDETGALGSVIDAGRPLVTDWLGLPAAASAAFIVGFFRRDFAATGLFVAYTDGQLNAQQAVVAMVTITLFIPCVASVLIIARERGARTAALMVATIFPFAFLVGGLLQRSLVLAGWGA